MIDEVARGCKGDLLQRCFCSFSKSYKGKVYKVIFQDIVVTIRKGNKERHNKMCDAIDLIEWINKELEDYE